MLLHEMPLPQPPAKICRVAVEGLTYGLPWTNVLWTQFAYTTNPTQADMDYVAGQMLALYAAPIKLTAHSSWSVETVTAVLHLATDSTRTGFAAGHTAGTRAGSGTPVQVAACISWHTDFDHYRGGHPRTYLAGVPVNDCGSNQFVSAYTTVVQSSANTLLSNWNGIAHGNVDSVTLGVLRRVRNGQPLDPAVFHAFTAGSCDGRIDTQRRRLGR